MLEVRPQACPAPERYCGDSATGGEGIDSLSWNLQLRETISTREQGVHQLLRLAHRTEAKVAAALAAVGDRKSTRLNSSHVEISYAVFCLKKKKLKKLMFVMISIATISKQS